MRRRAFVAGLPLAGCAGVWRRAAPAVEGRPAAAVPAVVEDTLTIAGSRTRVVRAARAGSAVVHVGVTIACGAMEDLQLVLGARGEMTGERMRPGLTALACAAVVDRGLRDELGRFGVVPRFRGALDGATVTCAALAEDVQAVVQALARRLRAPTLDAAGFAALVARMQAAAALAAADPKAVATRALDRWIYTDGGHEHPYAHRGAVPAEGDVGVTQAEVAAHVQRHVGPTNLLWVSTAEADLRPTIAAAWDGWTAPSSKNFVRAPRPRPRAAIVLVDRTGAEQATIAAGRLGPIAAEPDAVHAARAMRILRSTVHERLRGDRGLAYYTDGAYDGHAQAGRLRLVTQVDAAAAGEALGVVLWSLAHVQELAVAQAWMDEQDTDDALEQAYAHDRGEGRVSEIAGRWLVGLPLVDRETKARPVKKLMQVIDELMKPTHWQIVCVGDRRRVLAQLERFGPVDVR